MTAPQPTARLSRTLDPVITVMRTGAANLDLYDTVVAGIFERVGIPDGVFWHFGGVCDDELFSIECFRNPAAAANVFVEHSAPGITAYAETAEHVPDIARHEFKIERFILRCGEAEGFRFTEPGKFVVRYFSGPMVTRENYLATAREIDFPDDWPDGLLAHVVRSLGDRLGIFDLWRGDADRDAYYERRLMPGTAKQVPGFDPATAFVSRTIDVRALAVDLASADGQADYLRETSAVS